MANKKIYICVTDGCNLACKGCYKQILNITKPKFINLLKVEGMLKYIIANIGTDTIECVFHGGEPFYLNPDNQLQKYIDLIDHCTHPQVQWSATTNLMYELTPKHLELFNKFTNKFIKTSWDVDDYRFKNKEQLELWENNVKTLLSEKFVVEPIVTVNTQTIKHDPAELLEYFHKLGIEVLNFERITETGRAAKIKVKPTNREIDDWLYKVYKYNQDNTHFDIPLFSELVAVSQNQEPVGCRRRECMQNVRTINTDGSIGACPNTSEMVIVNNEGIYNKEIEDKLVNSEKNIENTCKFCKFYKICKGECCQLKFDETGCPGLLKILKELI